MGHDRHFAPQKIGERFRFRRRINLWHFLDGSVPRPSEHGERGRPLILDSRTLIARPVRALARHAGLSLARGRRRREKNPDWRKHQTPNEQAIWRIIDCNARILPAEGARACQELGNKLDVPTPTRSA